MKLAQPLASPTVMSSSPARRRHTRSTFLTSRCLRHRTTKLSRRQNLVRACLPGLRLAKELEQRRRMQVRLVGCHSGGLIILHDRQFGAWRAARRNEELGKHIGHAITVVGLALRHGLCGRGTSGKKPLLSRSLDVLERASTLRRKQYQAPTRWSKHTRV